MIKNEGKSDLPHPNFNIWLSSISSVLEIVLKSQLFSNVEKIMFPT